MKFKIRNIVGLSMAAMLLAAGLVGCAGGSTTSGGTNSTGGTGSATADTNAPINVISREDGSGTRGAFVEIFEVQTKNADGKKIDATTTNAVVTNSTSVMLTTVAGDKNAIGYISLGSLNDTVKALKIDGAEATPENVTSGDYKISRPFNIVTKGTPSAAAQDFINFILSADGQKVAVENNTIAVNANAPAYKKAAGANGKVVVAGSSSVSPVMEKLKEAYAKANPDVQVEIQTSDSGTGISSTVDGVCDIGMASRELKDSELDKGVTPTVIAIDGIAVVVNPQSAIDGLTKEQVQKIFLGEVTNWKDL